MPLELTAILYLCFCFFVFLLFVCLILLLLLLFFFTSNGGFTFLLKCIGYAAVFVFLILWLATKRWRWLPLFVRDRDVKKSVKKRGQKLVESAILRI